MARYHRYLVFIGLLGVVSAVVATALSIADRLGSMPAWLYGSPASRISSFVFLGPVPLELVAVFLFATVAILCAGYSRMPDSSRANLASYLLVLCVPLLSVHLGLGYLRSFRVVPGLIGLACSLAILIVVAVVAREPMRSLAQLPKDLRALLASPVGLGVSAAGLFVLGGVVQFLALRGPAIDARQAHADQFVNWFAQQPRAPIPIDSAAAPVVVTKFLDYQCAPCRAAFLGIHPLIQRINDRVPGAVELITRSYPLDPECNPATVRTNHPLACEAAAAVAAAKQDGQGGRLEEWLFENQRGLSADLLNDHLAGLGLLDHYEAGYAELLNEVKADLELGVSVGVRGTPTVFVNGVKLGSPSMADLELAIEYELAKVSVQALLGNRND